MLGPMIVGGQPLLGGSSPPAGADFTVTNDAEWDAVFANPAAELAGKVVEIDGSNFTQRNIADRDMNAAGAPLTIRSADANASLPAISLNGTVRGIDFSALNFQMTSWPYDHSACITLGTGTFGKLRFVNGTTFRHGYGPALTDFDTSAELSEYERVDNVRTATTSSTSHTLSWLDPAAPSGWIEFFNRGPETVFVEFGGPLVTATPASTQVAAGTRQRISPLDPDVDTHFAVLSASGTSEVNARTEVGLSEYLASPFRQTGGALLEDFEIRGCLFRDLSNGIKGLRPTVSGIVMDCDFDRIYQDIIALSPPPGASLHIFRNLECLPFARSGIAEDLNGDARDPHGDQFQMFNNVPGGTVGPVYYAGNRVRMTPRRLGIQSQGIFVSDNDFDPSFTELYFISTMQIGGAARALSLGEESTSFKIRDAFVYGTTIFNAHDYDSDLPFVLIDHDNDGTVYVGKSIAADHRQSDAEWQRDDLLNLSDAAVRSAVFPNLGAFASASNRSEIETALVSAAEGAGLGAVATGDAVDWTTADHTNVIRWENLPSGAHWNEAVNQSPDTLITLPLRKILNQRPSQTVSVGIGTEWRSVGTDRSTQVQGWTSANGSIEPGQFIQIRSISAATGGATITAAVTINGFEQSVTILTANVPTQFLIQNGIAGRFVDTANIPGGTARITFRGKFNFPGTVPNNVKPFTQSSTGCDLILQADGSMNATIEDGSGAKMATNLEVVPPGTLAPDTWHEIVFDVHQNANAVTVTVDGEIFDTAFGAASNGTFQSNRAISFIAGTTGNTPLPATTQFADLSVDLNGVPHKSISNDPAAANVDAWHQGGNFDGSP